MAESATEYPSGAFDSIREDVDAAYHDHVMQVSKARKTKGLDPYKLVPLSEYEQLREDYQQHVRKWADSGVDIQPIIKAVMLVDTATEENLPWYTAQITAGFESWREWNGRWTAEERPHGEVMVREMEAKGIVDMSDEWLPVREQNNETGIHIDIDSPADGLAYVATQELLTQKAHFASARVLDASGTTNMRLVGGDEKRHYQFYVTALRAMAREHPDYTLAAMRRQHEGRNFNMPGMQGIEGYNEMAMTIALGGLFDLNTIREAQAETITDAQLLDIHPITDQGKHDQDWAVEVADLSSKSSIKIARGMEAVRRRAAKRIESEEIRPFILGQTVELISNRYNVI